jgi:hypothetical protein
MKHRRLFTILSASFLALTIASCARTADDESESTDAMRGSLQLRVRSAKELPGGEGR